MDDFILEWLADVFGRPCEYEFKGESALDVIVIDENYCEENCGQPIKECWRRYFEILMAKKYKK